MSKANYSPPSLVGKPTKALVPPRQCQFSEAFTACPLLERITVSPTSSVLRFGLPDKSTPLNLSTCACILAKATLKTTGDDEDEIMEDVIRPYTPISTNELKGCFDLLIKDYGKKAKMSNHLCRMKIGDTVDFKHIDFNVKIQAPFQQKKIAMLVGGTGITPMIQALHAILGDNNVGAQEIVMLYGSKVEDDILGREMLDSWSKNYSDRFKLVLILSNEPDNSMWSGSRGFIDKEKLKTYLPDPSVGDDLIIFVCGPPPMYNALCGPRDEKELTGLLAELGYKKEQVYKF